MREVSRKTRADEYPEGTLDARRLFLLSRLCTEETMNIRRAPIWIALLAVVLLPLWWTRAQLENFGGTISVTSTPGAGTCVALSLRCAGG